MTSLGVDAFDFEVRRVYGRYVREVVERFSFCPWAQRARETGQVVVKVAPSATWDLGWAEKVTEEIAACPEWVIGILIFPRLKADFRGFSRRVTELRDAHAARHPVGDAPMAMAPFHPAGGCDVATAGRLTSFVRRSPDPTVQLVRLSTLQEIRRHDVRGTDYVDPTTVDFQALLAEVPPPPIHERILAANRSTLEATGVEAVDKILQSIQTDRDASYARALLAQR